MPVQCAWAPTQDGNIGEQQIVARWRRSDGSRHWACRAGSSGNGISVWASLELCDRCFAMRMASDGRIGRGVFIVRVLRPTE